MVYRKQNNRKKNVYQNNNLLWILGGIVILVNLLLVIYGVNDKEYFIDLVGKEEITVYEGSSFVDPGYSAWDEDTNDLTEEVKVSGKVDTSKVGEYILVYELNGVEVERKVIVKGKSTTGSTYLNLEGDLVIYLNPGEKFEEPGYSALSTGTGYLTSKVEVSDNINYEKPGTYKVVYSVVDSKGVTTTVSRTIIVLGGKISLTLSNNEKTLGPININVSVDDKYFDYLVLPNGSKVTSSSASYSISENGTYKFISYDTFGNKTENSIIVSNIYKPNVPVVTVYTSDNIKSGIKHSVGFMMKLSSSAQDIYYCIDDNNSCDPNKKYSSELRFKTSQQKYLRYKSCDSEGYCNDVKSYKVNLEINLSCPDVSTSGSSNRVCMPNPYHVAYYYQADDRWKNYYVYGDYKMRKVGCGYTAYAMIMTGVSHNYTVNPKTLFEQLYSFRKQFGVEFQTASSGGGLLVTGIENKYMQEKYGYEYTKFWQDRIYSTKKDSSSVLEEKEEKLVYSLKMGHMIFMRVPNHYIALVGIDENDKIYVFDPGARGTSLLTLDDFTNAYVDYGGVCSSGIECGFTIAYEVYPKGGISLDEWIKIN